MAYMAICPFATQHPVGNHSGPVAAHLGLILHVQEGNGSLASYFNNPSVQASSTFWVAKDGTLEQYVDTDNAAWAQSAGNPYYSSIESEGFTTEPLTDAQTATLGRLYAWGHATHNWPLILSESPGSSGLGWHGMGGAAWGGHTGCPGDIRKAQRQHILDIASGQSVANTPSGGLLSAEADAINKHLDDAFTAWSKWVETGTVAAVQAAVTAAQKDWDDKLNTILAWIAKHP